MLALLRNNHHRDNILLNQPFSKIFLDLILFYAISMVPRIMTKNSPVHKYIFRRLFYKLGGDYDSMVYGLEIPFGYGSYDICHLEMLNIVVASKLWAVPWKDKKNTNIL